MGKKNSYEKKAHKKQMLSGVHSVSWDKSKKAALTTGRDILIGAIGGGLLGAAAGKYSFVAGVVVTGIGHYMESNGTTALGVGMMASGGYKAISGVNGVNGKEQEGFEGVKERLEAFKEDLKSRLFLDKIIKSKKPPEDGTNGMGDVQYFTYPNNGKEMEGIDGNSLDLTALDRIEKQVADSAHRLQGNSMSGSMEEASEHNL